MITLLKLAINFIKNLRIYQKIRAKENEEIKNKTEEVVS